MHKVQNQKGHLETLPGPAGDRHDLHPVCPGADHPHGPGKDRPVRLRPPLRRTKDLRHILWLDGEIFADDDPVDVWDPNVLWWAAGDLAFCGVRPLSCGTSAFLLRAGVVEEARGRGLQRRMIQTRLRWAKTQERIQTVITYTIPENPWSSNNLIRCGFRLYEPQERWAGEAVNYFQKKIR